MLLATPACRPIKTVASHHIYEYCSIMISIFTCNQNEHTHTHQSLSFTYHRRYTISEADSVVKQNAKNYSLELVHSSVFLKYRVSETVHGQRVTVTNDYIKQVLFSYPHAEGNGATFRNTAVLGILA